jgi:hypothetical protein
VEVCAGQTMQEFHSHWHPRGLSQYLPCSSFHIQKHYHYCYPCECTFLKSFNVSWNISFIYVLERLDVISDHPIAKAFDCDLTKFVDIFRWFNSFRMYVDYHYAVWKLSKRRLCLDCFQQSGRFAFRVICERFCESSLIKRFVTVT